MQFHRVKVHPSKSNLKKQDQLAWKIAEIASDKAPIDKEATEMVINNLAFEYLNGCSAAE